MNKGLRNDIILSVIVIIVILIILLVINGNLHLINGNEIILQNEYDEILLNIWWI